MTVHLFLSPHLDDAVLSCGGQIAALADGGAQVQVVTVCAGRAQQRRGEDLQALALLGAAPLWLEELDAPMRLAAYQGPALWGDPLPDDPLPQRLPALLAALCAGEPDALLYAPLAIGGHVDHRVCRRVAMALQAAGRAVLYYEDLPYALVAPYDGPGELRCVDIAGHMDKKRAACLRYKSQVAPVFGGAAGVLALPQTERLWALPVSPASPPPG